MIETPLLDCNNLNASEILCELIRIPSVNPMGGTPVPETCFEHRMSDWLESYFRHLDVDYERIAVVPRRNGSPSRDNIIARYQAGDDRPTILLDAHQDTVPTPGMDRPFDPCVDAGKIHGRGACDVKGGMAAMLVTLARLTKERPPGAANVILSCSCDEEAGMSGVRALVDYWTSANSKSKLLSTRPDLAIVAEPTKLEIVSAHMGVVRLKVTASGRACHASEPNRGRNAIYAMIPVVDLLAANASALNDSTSHPSCGRAALNVGTIRGGSSVNIVPDECQIEVDRRLIPSEDATWAWEQIRDGLANFPDVRCEEPFLAAPALGSIDNSALVTRLQAAGAACGLHSIPSVGAKYCTNASTIESSGVPVVVFGPGSVEQAHTVDEHVEIDQLDHAAEIYYQFCSTYNADQPPGKRS